VHPQADLVGEVRQFFQDLLHLVAELALLTPRDENGRPALGEELHLHRTGE
jgi:hypothetical protein